MIKTYADLHCHPSGWAFNQQRNTELEGTTGYSIWNNEPSDLKKMAKGSRAAAYSQCDLGKLLASRTRLAFASLYPFEKDFFDERLIGNKLRKAERTTLLDKMQSRFMNFSHERINFFQSPDYDYFGELKLEYEFLKAGANQMRKITVRQAIHKHKYQQFSVQGAYRIAKNRDEVQGLMKEKGGIVLMILTVEGMHALGVGNPKGRGQDVSLDVLKERIRCLKGESDSAENWSHPVFFITFAHHFDNTLCGHAHSLPKIPLLSGVLNQDRRMNAGFEAKGLEVVYELLGIQKSGGKFTDTGSRRILIDVKHMAPAARKTFYEEVISPYNQQHPERKIPIVASHMGYAGEKQLATLIQNGDRERNNSKTDGFYRWGINLSDEDIRHIHESEGLIGLSFDQRILGANHTLLLPVFNIQMRRSVRAFARNILFMAMVPFREGLAHPERIWERFCIGTDFGGLIDPLKHYPTALEFPDLERDLIEEFGRLRKKYAPYFSDRSTEQLVADIMFHNAERFVLRHFTNEISDQKPLI